MAQGFIIGVLLLVISVLDLSEGARILAVCATPSISHQVTLRGLALALNKRGHEIVIVTTDPIKDPNLKNYTELDFHFLYNFFEQKNIIEARRTEKWYEFSLHLEPLFHSHSEKILEHPEFKKIYGPDSNEKFDLVILEMFLHQAFLPLGRRFNAPVVGVISMGMLLNIHYDMGNPILPSHPSHWEVYMRDYASFVPWQRLDNFITAWRCIYYVETEHIPKEQEIARKHFGNDIPNLRELQRNVSLIFTNQQLPTTFARPNLPNIIEINSFHVARKVNPLPTDLKKILDDAKQGFIYMSLGSNVKSTMLSEKLRGELTAAFSKVPYKVIWKFEDDTLKNKPDNVVILKWAPQEAILAHPNIKAFIYQGGLQSNEEAIAYGVPLIGFPIMVDQDAQVDKMVDVGVAKKLEITQLDRNDLIEAITTIANDDGYKQRMIKLRTLLKDRPYDLLENAVWWTEHVIRHQGAPYLRSSFGDDPWYQRGDMDVIAFISAASVIILSLTLAVLYKLIMTLVKIFATQSPDGKQKLN